MYYNIYTPKVNEQFMNFCIGAKTHKKIFFKKGIYKYGIVVL